MHVFFDFRDAICNSWNKLMRNPAYIGINAIFLFLIIPIAVALGFLSIYKMSESNFVLNFLAMNLWMLIITLFLGIAIQFGNIAVALHLSGGGSFKLSDVKRFYWQPRLFLPFLGLSILLGLLIQVGLVLLIIPGFYLIIKFYLAQISYMNRPDNGIFGALANSWKITEQNFGNTLLVWFLSILFSWLGILALGVGVLISTPFVTILMAIYYRALNGLQINSERQEETPLYDMHRISD